MTPEAQEDIRRRLREGYLQAIAEDIAELERTVNRHGPLMSRAEVLRGMRSAVPECVARTVQRERKRGNPLDDDFLRIAIEAFHEALDELIRRSVC